MFRIVFGNRTASDFTTGLTGVAATCAVGAVGLSLSLALAGASSTGAVGSVTLNTSQTATSLDQRSRELHAWPRPFAPTALFALRSSFSGNRLAQSSAAVDVLTGVQATGAAGNLADGVTQALSGNASTGSVGILRQNSFLSGVQATGSVGTMVMAGGTVQTGPIGSFTIIGTSVTFEDLIGTSVTSEDIIGTAITSADLIGTVDT